MKSIKYLSLLAFSGLVMAETTTQVVDATAESVMQPTPALALPAPEVVNAPVTDNVLPQLSFEAQQARAAEMAKEAEYARQQEEAKRADAQKQLDAENRIKQEIGNNRLLLTMATATVYAKNNFAPLWGDKAAERAFLKEYAVFAASGVSSKSVNALQQILNTADSFTRDILLTDSFLDYLYYSKNVSRNANKWLYSLGSYNPKSPDDTHIDNWLKAVKSGSAGQFVINLVPQNHIYQETVQRLFQGTSNTTPVVKSKGKKNTSHSANASLNSAKLALNAQRLRIIPTFNDGIFVNIPSYQLYYMRDGKLVLQSKVIVGRNDRRTPVLMSKLSNVVVNPPWNVPQTIKNKDLVPKLARNPGLAESMGYEIFDSKGAKVSASSINWSAYVGKNNFPYHIRQKASDNSALGYYKFNMPSTDAIYLHDTPNRGLFGKDHRALSSGCVRVAKADELATMLLKQAGWSDARKKSVLASKKTTSAPVRTDNPVYLYYVTSWVEGGKLYTLPDIYNLDSRIPRVAIDWAKVKNAI
ncbi:L,D-transpeptidase [Pasteurellaceae bacterium Macca]|nr:L,D-transpeptidase [Pasteurellaceae bacterium Macca]